MGLMSLPTMLKRGYSSSQATGLIAATGTLGQIIPPSIALVLLGDTLSGAYQQAQLNMGIFTPKTVSIGDLFVGAIVPGLILVVFYCLYLVTFSRPAPITQDETAPLKGNLSRAMKNLIPPIFLIVTVLGSILAGLATPYRGCWCGCIWCHCVGISKGQLTWDKLREVAQTTTKITSMVFFILIGAAVFSLVFRGLAVKKLSSNSLRTFLAVSVAATLLVMLVIFVLGFILDFIEITFVVVPIVAPVLLAMGLDRCGWV